MGSLFLGLFLAWYRGAELQSFHWFNDHAEWLAMDKIGHAFSVFCYCRILWVAFNWCRFSRKRALLYSVILPPVIWTSIELSDGFFPFYGASWGDIMANCSGAIFFGVQIYFFGKISSYIKFSFMPTELAAMRPGLLGGWLLPQILKDYNGQTYWLSMPVKKLTRLPFIPRWLLISFGYKGYGMVGARSNEGFTDNGEFLDFSHIIRERRFYLSLDVDYQKVRWMRNPKTRPFLRFLNAFKMPAPALCVSDTGRVRFYWMYW